MDFDISSDQHKEEETMALKQNPYVFESNILCMYTGLVSDDQHLIDVCMQIT